MQAQANAGKCYIPIVIVYAVQSQDIYDNIATNIAAGYCSTGVPPGLVRLVGCIRVIIIRTGTSGLIFDGLTHITHTQSDKPRVGDLTANFIITPRRQPARRQLPHFQIFHFPSRCARARVKRMDRTRHRHRHMSNKYERVSLCVVQPQISLHILSPP